MERIGDERADGFYSERSALKDESQLLGVAQELQAGG